MFNPASKPRYVHDCDNCLFLGCYRDFDVYWCQDSTSIDGGSIIARNSDLGPDYQSSPVLIALYGTNQGILFKVAQYLLHSGLIKLQVNQEVIEEKKPMFEDLWKMRKET